ncbi:hypothetical protein GPECTOR_13g691 [Gonium pectorale]|uniref:Protein kinase domain-containing protein n=1 Tax=Gonium pectorale TaxID=33097 RepID=A0A150GN31_GONPE|nr:hypothetical protein GPECTOR_13g691 [Gonium pectorale]|eukprot:KXZ51204.1 hypothetical protein GPECTOR_13g691 [Gonium pectorale]
MAMTFSNEAAREAAFHTILGPYLRSPIHSHFPDKCASLASTDGSIIHVIHVAMDGHLRQFKVPVYLEEVKVEVGSSGDPYFEGQRYYQLYLTNESLAPVVQRSVLPALFVELVGPHMRVSLLASPEDACVVCEPVTPFLHFFNMLSSQPDHMARVARVLRALKCSIGLLRGAYDELAKSLAAGHSASPAAAPPSQPGRDPSLQLPYPLRPGSGFRKVEAVLMARGATNRLYVAEQEDSGRQVVVKFASAISKDAIRVHHAWAAAGLAPALLSERRLPCGLTMLVMERLRPEDGWAMFRSLAPELKLQLNEEVLKKLEDAHGVDVDGKGKAVHADMRQANVMIKMCEDGQEPARPLQVRFLDFDWSGLVGQTRLPPFMRERLPGYTTGVAATQEYDRALWRLEMEKGDS